MHSQLSCSLVGIWQRRSVYVATLSGLVHNAMHELVSVRCLTLFSHSSLTIGGLRHARACMRACVPCEVLGMRVPACVCLCVRTCVGVPECVCMHVRA
eukprot:jgi/Botrbrau1/4283/Bobra.0390s0023.1